MPMSLTAVQQDVAAPRPDRRLELVSAAILVFYACAQVVQAFILAGMPPPEDVVAMYRFDLSAPNQVRLVLLFPCFCAMPAIYAAVYRRLRPSPWAAAGAGWIGLFIGFELLNRGFEIGNVFAWERAFFATDDAGLKAKLADRIAGFNEAQATALLLILIVYAMASVSFALAIRGRDRWSRIAKVGFQAHAARLALRFGAGVLGLSFLGPAAEALFLPITLLHALAMALWLAMPPGEDLSSKPGPN